MVRLYLLAAALLSCITTPSLWAQTTRKVDFGRDVLPIFQQNCVGCHGPSQQMAGLRLDRRSSVLRQGTRRVVPGGLDNSLLYHRLIGNEFGLQMPPTGPLRPEQINLIKTWIEEGAEWPAELANEADLPPLNPKAVAMVDALWTGNRQSFMKFVAEDPKLLNARGPEGSTPFMYAVLYSDAATLEQLLKKGADPNVRNDAKASALIWAATDLEKTRVLLASNADVNARSDNFRTPLMTAARRPGGARTVKILLDNGANPNPSMNPSVESSPLLESATAGDWETMQLLLDRGAEVKGVGGIALALALTTKCSKCVDLLVAKELTKLDYTIALLATASLGDVRSMRLMIDRGADVNAVDPQGRTALMYAVTSDLLPVDAVKLLIERGANVNAKSQHKDSGDSGQTVLDLAKLRGETAIVDLLIKAGATTVGRPAPSLKTVSGNTAQAAIQRSLPLLQRNDATFIPKAGCVSCHNNSLEAMTVATARKNGFRVDEKVAAEQVKANVSFLEASRDKLHQGIFVNLGDVFGAGVLGYILVGLDAEGYKPDLNTDAVAMYLKNRQAPAGNWEYGAGDVRPPLCSSYIGQTALSMRALQLYAPKVDKAGYERSIQLAAQWLAKAEAKTNEDRFWRLLGLAWAATDKEAIKNATREVLALQRADGGWSDLPSIDSNAYATGRAMFALHNAGVPVSDSAYKRGMQYLLNTQAQDGSWYVKTRATGFQPYFDNGFPYGVDQWISAAGTSWATMALTLASQKSAASASAPRANQNASPGR
jgi:ankyrin repeat protein